MAFVLNRDSALFVRLFWAGWWGVPLVAAAVVTPVAVSLSQKAQELQKKEITINNKEREIAAQRRENKEDWESIQKWEEDLKEWAEELKEEKAREYFRDCFYSYNWSNSRYVLRGSLEFHLFQCLQIRKNNDQR